MKKVQRVAIAEQKAGRVKATLCGQSLFANCSS